MITRRSGIESEIEELFDLTKEKVNMLLSEMSRITLCLDMWTKKGMTASFLGISACGYYPGSKAELNFILNLHVVKHPHIGEMIGDSVEATMKSWGIRPSNVLEVITDNGANMVEAFSQSFH